MWLTRIKILLSLVDVNNPPAKNIAKTILTPSLSSASFNRPAASICLDRKTKKESLDLQGFLDGSGDRIRTNDTPGMKRAAPASGRLITQQKT